jgi:hypothetical protein
MSLEHLAQRFRAQRVDRGARGHARIRVMRGDRPGAGRRHTGKVRIDDQTLGYLVASLPTVFEVEPGDHTVKVQLGRRDLVSSAPGAAVASTKLSIGQGEEATLTCGVRPDVASRWSQLNRFGSRRGIRFAFAIYAFAAAGWLASPFVQEWIAAAIVYYAPAAIGWLGWINHAIGPISLSFLSAIAGGWVVGQAARGASPQAAIELESRIGSPYFLEQEDALVEDATATP